MKACLQHQLVMRSLFDQWPLVAGKQLPPVLQAGSGNISYGPGGPADTGKRARLPTCR